MPPKPMKTPTSIAGHALAAVIGLGALAGGIAAATHDMPGVMCLTLLLAGVCLPALAWFSLAGSRACWSFTLSLTAVLGLITLFAVPKVHRALDIPFALAALVPLACIVAITLLSTLGPDYRGDGTSSK